MPRRLTRARSGARRITAREEARWTLPAVLTIGIILAIVGRLHDAVAPGTVPVGKVLLGVGLFALLTGPSATVAVRAWGTPQGKALALFTGSVFLSLPFSYLRSGTLEIATAFATRTVPFILIMLLTVRAVGDVSRILRGMVVMQILMGVLILAGFGVVIDGPDGPRTTLSGSYDPNDLAMVMATCGAASLWALRDRSRGWRTAGLLALGLGMYVTVRTYSRGGAIAFAVMIGMTLVLARHAVPRWLRLAMIPAVGLALMVAPKKYIERLGSLGQVSTDYNITEASGRTQIWKRGIGYFLERPFTGVGAGQFGQAEGRYGESIGRTAAWKWSAAHNMYIESLAELGLPGFVALLGMLLPSVSLWWRERRRIPSSHSEVEYRRQVETVAVAVITFMAATMFLSATFSPMVMLLATLGIALRLVPEAARSSEYRRPSRRHRGERPMVGVR